MFFHSVRLDTNTYYHYIIKLMLPTCFIQEPELNKAMVLLLARCWEYKLKTEDVLELTQVPIFFVILLLIFTNGNSYTHLLIPQFQTLLNRATARSPSARWWVCWRMARPTARSSNSARSPSRARWASGSMNWSCTGVCMYVYVCVCHLYVCIFYI